MHALTLATWNVRRPSGAGNARRDVLRRYMDAVAADVWVLTETHDALVPGDGYAAVSTSGADRAQWPGERWVTIWSRLPIEPLPPTSDPIRTVAARVHIGERRAVVYGTVLPWVGSPWRDVPAAAGAAFAAALEAQVADWRALRAAYPDDALIVMGDLNQDLVDHPPHYYGSRSGRERLRSALASAGLTALTGGAADPIRTTAAPCACIDHICLAAGPDWRTAPPWRWPDGARPARGVSDHFGVGVRMEVGDGGVGSRAR